MKYVNRYIRIFSFYLVVIILFLFGTFVGNKTVSVIARNMPISYSHTIVIDPGHGGFDGGATSCTGRLESEYNLEISLKLYEIFRLLGYHSRIIRKTDTAVNVAGESIAQKKVSDLKERVRIANGDDRNILISIHQNTFSDSQYSGAQVFYANSSQSEKFAEEVQRSLASNLQPESTRKCKKGTGIYLLEKCSCPGILVECGFLSNKQEEANLREDHYQMMLASVIAIGTISWIGILDQVNIA